MGTHDAQVEPKSSQVGQSGADPGGGAPGGFHGGSRHPVDAKGRLFVPKRFLPGLPFSSEGQVPVTVQPSPDGRCLWLRPGTLQEPAVMSNGLFDGVSGDQFEAVVGVHQRLIGEREIGNGDALLHRVHGELFQGGERHRGLVLEALQPGLQTQL